MKPLNQLSRKELYELAWSEAMATLAPKLGISDVGLKKRCRVLSIPTPPRGYWAKLDAGKKVKREPLPDTWTIERKKVRVPQSPDEVRRFHPQGEYDTSVLAGAAKRTLAQLRRKRPTGQLVAASGEGLLTTAVAPECVDRAVCLWGRLLDALQEAGLKRLADSGSFSDGVESLTLQLVEKLSAFERPYDPKIDVRYRYYSDPPKKVRDYVKTGFLIFQADDIGTPNSRQWKDTPLGPLDEKINEIALEALQLLKRKHEMKLEEEERCRRREEERRLEAIEAEKRRVEKDRREALIARTGEFRQAEAIRSLVGRLETLDKNEHLLDNFLTWAKKVADDIDPCDDIIQRARDGHDPVKPKPWWL